MNSMLSRTVLGLLSLAAIGIVTGGGAQLPEASGPDATPAQVIILPTQCLAERNHGACVTCCKEATDAPTWACSRFCKDVVPPTPGPDPQP